MNKIEVLKRWVGESNRIVAFTGAGVSTESGIPDFRSVDGLYNQKWKYPPETILSHTFFERYPEEYYRFHHEKLQIGDAKPNAAHLKLAELESRGKLKAVITQNIDGLLLVRHESRKARIAGNRFRRNAKRHPDQDTVFSASLERILQTAVQG